jgi:hypothetical protein
MYERTAIAIFGDHGEEMGERMKMAAHHRNLCEEVTRVPLLMRIPGHAKVAVDANSRLIDVMPTVLGALGIDPKTVMQGKDLAPYIRGNEAVDLPVFSEYHSNPYSAISVRTSFFQLICNSKTTLVSKLADKYLRYKFGKKGSTVRKWKFRPASIVKATFRRLLGRVQKDKAFDELVFINFRNSKDKAVLLGTESGEGPVQRLRDMIDQQMRENELLRKTLVKDGPQTVELQDDMRKRLHELGYI